MVRASSWSWVTITVALDRPCSTSLIWPRIGLAQLDVEARRAARRTGSSWDRARSRGRPRPAASRPRPAGRACGRARRSDAAMRATRVTRLGDLGRGQAARQCSGKARFSRTRKARVEGVELEHHGDVALAPAPGRSRAGRRSMMSPAVARLEPGDHAQGRGLAAARRAEQADHLARARRRGRPRRPRARLPNSLVTFAQVRWSTWVRLSA